MEGFTKQLHMHSKEFMGVISGLEKISHMFYGQNFIPMFPKYVQHLPKYALQFEPTFLQSKVTWKFYICIQKAYTGLMSCHNFISKYFKAVLFLSMLLLARVCIQKQLKILKTDVSWKGYKIIVPCLLSLSLKSLYECYPWAQIKNSCKRLHLDYTWFCILRLFK